MSQIFIMGASITYGVGGETGGWADMLKLALQKKIFSMDGTGEKNEIYNFAKPGATADFVARNYKQQLNEYRNEGEVTVILSVGMNNTKAIDSPENYVSTIDDFEKLMLDLIKEISSQVDRFIFLGYSPCDENKTYPKLNPLTGKDSYFSNERIFQFNDVVADICNELNVEFIGIDINQKDWITSYLYEDGLHPNKKGHEYIFGKIKKVVEL